jgi:hypothetical protein
MSKANAAYEHVEGSGAGIVTKEIILDHSNMTDSGSTTGTYNWTYAVPPYGLRLACLVETLETFNAACTVAVGITAAGNTWTSATTGTCTTIGYKHLFPYGAATIITGAEHTTAAGESVHVTLTVASWAAITSGKIKLRILYLATQ